MSTRAWLASNCGGKSFFPCPWQIVATDASLTLSLHLQGGCICFRLLSWSWGWLIYLANCCHNDGRRRRDRHAVAGWFLRPIHTHSYQQIGPWSVQFLQHLRNCSPCAWYSTTIRHQFGAQKCSQAVSWPRMLKWCELPSPFRLRRRSESFGVLCLNLSHLRLLHPILWFRLGTGTCPECWISANCLLIHRTPSFLELIHSMNRSIGIQVREAGINNEHRCFHPPDQLTLHLLFRICNNHAHDVLESRGLQSTATCNIWYFQGYGCECIS